MAAKITNLPALDPVILQSISEALFEGYFRNPEISNLLSIEEGIKAQKQIIVFGRHTGLSGFNRTACDTTANTSWTVPATEKTWSPKYIGDRFAECFDDYMDSFVRWGLKNGVNKSDLTGTELAAFLTEQLGDNLFDVFMRHAWFGDTAIAAGVNNNLGAGSLKYFNAIDGIWKQIFAIVTATAARNSGSLTSKNGQATFALQKFNSTDTTNLVVSNALDKVWYDADMRLRGMNKSDLVFLVTQTVADQYEKERKSVGAAGILEAYRRTEDGVPQLQNNGIDVVPVHFWDRTIQSYLEDGANWTVPHRIILTSKTNLMLGVESSGDLAELDVWYSKDDEKTYMKFGASIDAKVGVDALVQVDY